MQQLLPRYRSTLSRALFLAPVLALSATGCGQPDDEPGRDHAGLASLAGRVTHPAPCSLVAADSAVALFATEDGIALGLADPSDPETGAVVRRYRGSGCALSPDGSAPAAVRRLLDADARGNLYAFPRESSTPGVISTFPPDYPGGSSEGVVVRIDAAGRASAVVSASRGIWTFGVSPSGGTFWSTACGPTGIFATGSRPLREVMPPPATGWERSGAVLSDDSTLWSSGGYACSQGQPQQDCGYKLVRSTPSGDQVVGKTDLNLGADKGSESPGLVRCGARLCGVTSSAIGVWSSDGEEVHRFDALELGVRTGERITRVTGNRHGLYALIGSEGASRLVFVPL